MCRKLSVFLACLALSATASLPLHSAVGELQQAFETEDAIYIPISNEEADALRLPRSIQSINTIVHFDPPVELNSHEKSHRFRRSADGGLQENPTRNLIKGPFAPQAPPSFPDTSRTKLPDERQPFRPYNRNLLPFQREPLVPQNRGLLQHQRQSSPFNRNGFFSQERPVIANGSHQRFRRAVSGVIETEDASYIPVSDEEIESLRLPRNVNSDQKTESEVFFIPDEYGN